MVLVIRNITKHYYIKVVGHIEGKAFFPILAFLKKAVFKA